MADFAGGDVSDAGDRRRQQLRPAPDAHVCALESGDNGKPNGGGASKKWSSEMAPASTSAAAHSGRIMNSRYRRSSDAKLRPRDPLANLDVDEMLGDDVGGRE
jgi:hypothetical protein